MMLRTENRIINTDNIQSIARARNSLVFIGVYGPLSVDFRNEETAQKVLELIFRTKQSHLDLRET